MCLANAALCCVLRAITVVVVVGVVVVVVVVGVEVVVVVVVVALSGRYFLAVGSTMYMGVGSETDHMKIIVVIVLCPSLIAM